MTELATNYQSDFETFKSEWVEHANQIHSSEVQQPTTTEDGRGLHFEELTLYHGSTNAGIKEFESAEEVTITGGLYATYNPSEAIEYAIERTQQGARGLFTDTVRNPKDFSPVLYEVTIKDVTLLDLRSTEAIEELLVLFKDRLVQWVADNAENPEVKNYLFVSKRLIEEATDPNTPVTARLKKMTPQVYLLTSFLQEKGYNGVIAMEGGEGSMDNHESWVIFDPTKVIVTGETGFKNPKKIEDKTQVVVESNSQDDWWN